MKSNFDCVGIDAISTVIPNNLQLLNEDFLGINSVEIDKITNITGITQVAITPHNVTASDLCIHAAKVIFESKPSYLNEIDVVIFVSQSRDFILPTSSSIIQSKLGLSINTLCLDVPSGCTGYLHGLFLASTLIQANASKRVLLLCGETNSKLINKGDKSMSMIFGDGGSATILSKKLETSSYFNFKTDGAGYDKIIIPDGGCRSPFNKKSLEVLEYENANKRCFMDMKMDGMSVFNFAITAVPKVVSEALSDCSLDPGSINLFAAHQANQLIVSQLAKKCGFNPKQSPFLASRYGNTGPTSIPLLLSEGFSGNNSDLKKVMMCGFGVGLNWGACLTDLSNTEIYPTNFFEN